MPTISPRKLDQAVERRWPKLFAEDTYSPLYLSASFLVVAAVLVLMGPPFSGAAGAAIGGALALHIRVLRAAKQNKAAALRDSVTDLNQH